MNSFHKESVSVTLLVLLLTLLARPSQAQPYVWNNELSNSCVTSMAEDQNGFIWIGTMYGLNRYDGASYQTFFSSSRQDAIKNNYIYDVAADKDGGIWFGSRSGMYYYKGGRFSVENSNTIFNPVTRIILQDDDHIIALGYSGIARFSMESDGEIKNPVFERLSDFRNGRVITNMAVSPLGDVWFTAESENGSDLHILDEKLNTLDSFSLSPSKRVRAVETDVNGDVWIVTESGIESFDMTSRRRTDVTPSIKSLIDGEHVLFTKKYGQYEVIIGIRDKGLFVYNFRSGDIHQTNPEEKLPYSRCICLVDSRKNVWIADGESSFKCLISGADFIHNPHIQGHSHILQMDMLDNGLMQIQSSDGYFTYDHRSGMVYNLTALRNMIPVQLVDKKGFLWISDSYGNLLKYRRAEKESLSLVGKYKVENGIVSVMEISDGSIMVFSGDKKIYRLSPGSDSLELFYSLRDAQSLPVSDKRTGKIYITSPMGNTLEVTPEGVVSSDLALNSVSCMLTATDGTIWYGTYNKGLVHLFPDSGEQIIYDETNYIIDSDIKSVIEDNDGNIWFSTSKHITKYDIALDKFTVLFDNELPSDGYYENRCACIDGDGILYFGGSSGQTIIDPSAVLTDSYSMEPEFILDEVSSNGENLDPPFSRIVLSHSQKNLRLRFVAIDYRQGTRINYSYQLEGLDGDWINTRENVAVYSNLPAGRYLFRARTRMANGEWSENEIAVPVVVRHSVWESLPAKVMYVLLALMFISLLARTRTQKMRLSLGEQKERMQEEYIDFLTNVAHEFRTPLSLVYGPLEQLLQSQDIKDSDRQKLEIMKSNVNRLVDLSEKSLDASATRFSDKILKAAPQNLYSFMNDISGMFSYISLEKDIKFTTEAPSEEGVYFDREKVEKILYNLLSNAFKYTDEHGNISFGARIHGDDLVFWVKDDGIGIPEQNRAKIFSQFDRLGAENYGIKGSGIGLFYSQSLALVHKGRITYLPGSPKGSEFHLTIPCMEHCYTESEKATSGTIVTERGKENEGQALSEQKHSSILLVEDNEDVRVYLRSLLSRQYNIIACTDGEEGLDMARSLVPDLVISDVMMPVKDGFELCRDIKSDSLIRHIPVILLTAKADQSSSIKGLQGGAEAYISKPFSPDYLMATIESILVNRKNLQARISELTPSTIQDETIVKETGLSQEDKKFLDKVHSVLKENLGDEKYSVNSFAQEMGMSYSSLYAKMKALTGISPLSYMNTFKMNIAKEMLLDGKHMISEIAYTIGASTPSNFSKLFKQQFGMTPTQMKAMKGMNPEQHD